MRKSFLALFLIVAIGSLVTLFWRSKQLAAPPPPTKHAIQPTNAPSKSLFSDSQRTLPVLAVILRSNGPPLTVYSNEMSNPDNFRRYVEAHNVSIDFYGLVIDQDSNALPGVDIKSAVRHWTMPNPAVLDFGTTEIPVERTTGTDGRFEIHGVSGDGCGVVITKDGYDPEPGPRGFGGGTSGSYENPVIFKMWSTNIHEQLITGNKSYEIVPDGRCYFINLADGSIAEHESGDLIAWIRYTNQVVKGQFYDWSAGIEVINGGLLEVPQAAINGGFIGEPPFAMYSAPAEGYVPSFSLTNRIKGGQSGEIGDRYFYLRLNNGKKYGRMSINLFAPYGSLHPGLIRLSYAINPSGSGILR